MSLDVIFWLSGFALGIFGLAWVAWQSGMFAAKRQREGVDMHLNDSPDQVVFMPTDCQEEVSALVQKFTSLESNINLSELNTLLNNHARGTQLSGVMTELKRQLEINDHVELRELSVEAYVVEMEGAMRDYVQVIVSASQPGHDIINKTEALLKQIDSIFVLVDGLRHIADQTGLLALNAAIEAAKSGDLGRSYAYMASEVKRLSAQSDHFGGDIRQEMEKAKSSVQASSNLVDQMVISDLHIALETRAGIDQLIGQLQSLSVVETLGFSSSRLYGRVIAEMHKILVVVLMKIELISRLGLVEGQLQLNLKDLNQRLLLLYRTKVVKND